MAETVIIKDTWDVVSKQVKAIGMEAFDKLWTLNSDMSAYLPQAEDIDIEETRLLSDKVRASAKMTLDTLEEVIATIPDMTEVFCVITRMKKAHPETALLEVIGPVFCNTTRHFLLIQVGRPKVIIYHFFLHSKKFLGSLVPGRGEGLVGAVWRTFGNDQSELLRPARARPRAGEWIECSHHSPNVVIFCSLCFISDSL